MTHTRGEVLIQRFVDDELTRDERLELLDHISQDDTLRGRLRTLERLVTAARALTPVSVPPRLVARALDRLPGRAAGPLATFHRALLRPRAFQWNPAQALAAAAGLALLAVWAYPARRPAPPIPQPTHWTVASGPTVLVRFVLVNDQAASVSVAGDFNGWNPARTPLKRTGSGAWTVTVPMRPGRYNYMYVVNGQEWIPDPTAGEASLDGFGAENSVLNVES